MGHDTEVWGARCSLYAGTIVPRLSDHGSTVPFELGHRSEARRSEQWPHVTGRGPPGARAHQVGSGWSGTCVQLFSAACLFNGRVGTTGASFTEVWNGDLARFVDAFQRFSALEISRVADYPTWAQLLVSTGDPDRPASACGPVPAPASCCMWPAASTTRSRRSAPATPRARAAARY